MRIGVTTWISAALIAGAATSIPLTNRAAAQDFKIPMNVSHFVYRPGENLAELEEVHGFTFGLGLVIGVREAYSPNQRGIYGFVAQATFGGPYWYWGAGAGMWNSGSPVADNYGFGVNFNYNVFQSRDYRTRLGPQFGWGTASDGTTRTHVWTYRAMMSHTVSESVSLYGGMGAETSRFSAGGNPTKLTSPSVLAGIHTRLGDRFGLSTGLESVFTDPLTLTFASSVQFEGADKRDNEELRALRSGLGRRQPIRR